MNDKEMGSNIEQAKPRHPLLRAVKAWAITILCCIAALALGFFISNGISALRYKSLDMTPVDVDLLNIPEVAAMAPGGEQEWTPQIINSGKRDAFVYFQIACYAVDGTPLYDFDVNPAWELVEEDPVTMPFPDDSDPEDIEGHALGKLTRTYAYKQALAAGETTAPVFGHITMVIDNYQSYITPEDDFGLNVHSLGQPAVDGSTAVESWSPYIWFESEKESAHADSSMFICLLLHSETNLEHMFEK